MWVLQQHHFISLSSKLMIRESNGLRQKGRRKSSSQKIEWADESEELFPLQMIPVTLFLRCLEDICCSLHSQPQKNLFLFYHFLLHRKLTYLIDNLMDNFFNQYEEVIQDPGLKANTHTHTHTHAPAMNLLNTCTPGRHTTKDLSYCWPYLLKYTYRNVKPVLLAHFPLL